MKPGSYIALCSVFNGYHVANGMYTRLTVGTNGIDFNTGKWS